MLSSVFNTIIKHTNREDKIGAAHLEKTILKTQGVEPCKDIIGAILPISTKLGFIVTKVEPELVSADGFFDQPVLIVTESRQEVVIAYSPDGNRIHLSRHTEEGYENTIIPFAIDEFKRYVQDDKTSSWWVASVKEELFGSILFDTDLGDEGLKGRPLKRFLRMLAPDTKDIGFIYLYAIFAGLLNLTLPLGIQAIINQISSGEQVTTWFVLIGFILFGITLAGGMQIMQMSIIEFLQQKVFVRAAFQFSQKIPRLKYEALSAFYPPELINRFFDVLTVQKGLSKILMDFSTSTLQILFGLILLSLYHPFFIAFGVFLLLILMLLIRYTAVPGLATSLVESKYKYAVVYWLEEVARNLVSFKLGGFPNLVYEKVDVLVAGYLKARKSHFRILIFQFSSIVAFKVLVTAGLLIMGSVLVFQREINVGQFVAAEIVIILLLVAVEKLILTLETVYDVLTAVEKIGNVTDLEEETDKGVGFKLIDQKTGISIKAEKLGYIFNDPKKPILKDLDFTIAAGERICITGSNGSGRSTLINILSGLFTGFSGNLLYNGLPAANINMDSLRSHIGDNLVTENIFSGTLEENITMGKPYISYRSIVEVAEIIDLMDFVKTLPEGFNTQLIADDRRISSSTVKKIILARSIVCQPRLLVIDDFLINAHPAKTPEIAKYIMDRDKPYTLITVSNNKKVAELCDRVMVLKDGVIAANGSLEQIIKEGYGHMFDIKEEGA